MKHCEHCKAELTTSAYRVNVSVEFMGVLDQKMSLLCRSCADTAGAFERLDFPSFETVRDTTMHTVKSPCQNCGLVIMQKPSERIYSSCGDSCRDSIARRQRKIAPKSKPCGHCGELFSPKRKTARFCSDKCRVYSSRAN